MKENILKKNVYDLMPEILKAAARRKLWIYGCGKGGGIIRDLLVGMNVPFAGMIDRQNFPKAMGGYPICKINELKPEEDYILISAMSFSLTCEMIKNCLYHGFSEMDFISFFEKRNAEVDAGTVVIPN